jgi:hypothetical protein
MLLILVSFAAAIRAEVIPYNRHTLYPLQPEYWTIPKYAKLDAPSWAPGNGRSFIDFSGLRAHTKCKGSDSDGVSNSCTNSSLNIIMFEEPTGKDWTGI